MLLPIDCCGWGWRQTELPLHCEREQWMGLSLRPRKSAGERAAPQLQCKFLLPPFSGKDEGAKGGPRVENNTFDSPKL